MLWFKRHIYQESTTTLTSCLWVSTPRYSSGSAARARPPGGGTAASHRRWAIRAWNEAYAKVRKDFTITAPMSYSDLCWRVDMILARAGRQMVTICYYGRLEVFLAGCSPGPVDKPNPAATSPLSRNPLADLLSDVVMVKTGNKWISIRDKIILDIFDTQYSIDKKFRV